MSERNSALIVAEEPDPSWIPIGRSLAHVAERAFREADAEKAYLRSVRIAPDKVSMELELTERGAKLIGMPGPITIDSDSISIKQPLASRVFDEDFRQFEALCNRAWWVAKRFIMKCLQTGDPKLSARVGSMLAFQFQTVPKAAIAHLEPVSWRNGAFKTGWGDALFEAHLIFSEDLRDVPRISPLQLKVLLVATEMQEAGELDGLKEYAKWDEIQKRCKGRNIHASKMTIRRALSKMEVGLHLIT